MTTASGGTSTSGGATSTADRRFAPQMAMVADGADVLRGQELGWRSCSAGSRT